MTGVYCRGLSEIVHALKSGGRWGDCPEHVYGPEKTLCFAARDRFPKDTANRFIGSMFELTQRR